MTSLPRFSVNNPILVNLFMVTLLLGGVYHGLKIVREMFPESRPNRVLITTAYPGATPSEVEKGITLKIEEEIKDVEGIEKITSTINEGLSMVLVELKSGFEDVDQAVNDIKAAIDTIPTEDFPEEAKETAVSKFDPKWPVISVALYGDVDDRVLKTLGEQLREEILLLPDITDVVLSGTRKDEISVEVRPEKLAEFNLSFMDVAGTISASNVDLPGGQVRTPRANVSVRTLGEKDRGEDLYDIVIRSDPSGRVVTLRNVATIIDGFEDTDVVGRFNGAPAVDVTIYKTADQDAIKIASLVKALVAGKKGNPLAQPWTDRLLARLSGENVVLDTYKTALADPFPSGVSVEVHTDLSRFIEGRLDLLKRNGGWGLLLVLLSLLVFLHWRVAFWVMMGLLLAIAGSLIFMEVLGLTLNLITMFGLIIVLGLLVDDAIIVSEHVYTKIEEGVESKQAAIEGTEEVTWPVVCAIVTTIVAFIPLMFIEGQMGDWMGVLPVVVCIALSVSLVEALTILPSHLGHGLRHVRPTSTNRERSGGTFRRLSARIRETQNRFVQQWLRMGYERLLRRALDYRYVTIAALVACLLVVCGLYAGGHVPFVFLPTMDSETLIVEMDMDVGTPIDATLEAFGVVERATMDLPELKSIYTLLGLQVSVDGLASAPQSHLAQAFIELTASEERQRTSNEILQELRLKTGDIPGAQNLKFGAVHGGPGGAAIQLDISGGNIDRLTAVADEIKSKLAEFEGVSDIVDDFDAGQREVQIELFKSARALGLTTHSLATQVRSAFYGFEARKVQRGREDVKIMVRYAPEYRRNIYEIESMRIATPSGALVPFTEVARLTEATGFASIKRVNQRRTVTVTADVNTETSKARPEQIMAEMATSFPSIMQRHPGIRLEYGGQKLETTKSFGSLKQSFTIVLVLIYVILAGLFKSYIQPIIVLSIVPFGLIGAIAGHLVMGYPLTILSLIGLVALTGIVVNDSMILVSFINRLVQRGTPVMEAVIEGGKGRLRPILLTSATTVLGIAPLLMEKSFQAKFLIPMGISIAAGLLFATVLTLIAVPALYLIVGDLKAAITGFVAWLLGRPQAVPETGGSR